MPQIRYIPAPPSPVRRKPRNVDMTIQSPAPYRHRGCGKDAILYADGVIWCESCGHAVKVEDCVDKRRGRLVPHVQPTWTLIETK